MGRKWAKGLALTEDDVLYVSENPDPKDVERFEKKASESKAAEAELNQRFRALGAKWE